MDINEKLFQISKVYSDRTIDKITETKSYFLVSLDKKGSKKPLYPALYDCDDRIVAIDKKTGDFFTYNPVIHGK